MKMTEFCDHLYDESTDGYIQILKLDDKIIVMNELLKYNTKNDGLKTINMSSAMSFVSFILYILMDRFI